MSKTVTIPAIWKLLGDLTYKERISIQREMEVPIREAAKMDSPYLDELVGHLVYVAARRLHRDDITRAMVEDMRTNDMDMYLMEFLPELGFEDETFEVDDDGVPLVMQDSQTKNESSDETSETQNSGTSTTTASSSDGV